MFGIPTTDRLVSPEKRLVASNRSKALLAKDRDWHCLKKLYLAFISVIWHHLGVTISINDYLFYQTLKL